MYETIEVDVSERVATIFFNRPGKKNAYTPLMGDEIVAALDAAMADEGVRVAILTGRGDAYCGGVDLDFLKAHMAGEDTGPGSKLGEEHFVNGWPLDVVAYPKPVIAAINGAAYGVGVTMTLGCDLRVAARGAKLGLNFAKLGVLPGLGSTHHLPRLVGMGKALQWVLTGASLTAEDAHAAGLVQELTEPGETYARARELALAMAGIEPAVLQAARTALRHGAEATLEEAIAGEKRASAGLAALRRAGQ